MPLVLSTLSVVLEIKSCRYTRLILALRPRDSSWFSQQCFMQVMPSYSGSVMQYFINITMSSTWSPGRGYGLS